MFGDTFSNISPLMVSRNRRLGFDASENIMPKADHVLNQHFNFVSNFDLTEKVLTSKCFNSHKKHVQNSGDRLDGSISDLSNRNDWFEDTIPGNLNSDMVQEKPEENSPDIYTYLVDLFKGLFSFWSGSAEIVERDKSVPHNQSLVGCDNWRNGFVYVGIFNKMKLEEYDVDEVVTKEIDNKYLKSKSTDNLVTLVNVLQINDCDKMSLDNCNTEGSVFEPVAFKTISEFMLIPEKCNKLHCEEIDALQLDRNYSVCELRQTKMMHKSKSLFKNCHKQKIHASKLSMKGTVSETSGTHRFQKETDKTVSEFTLLPEHCDKSNCEETDALRLVRNYSICKIENKIVDTNKSFSKSCDKPKRKIQASKMTTDCFISESVTASSKADCFEKETDKVVSEFMIFPEDCDKLNYNGTDAFEKNRNNTVCEIAETKMMLTNKPFCKSCDKLKHSKVSTNHSASESTKPLQKPVKKSASEMDHLNLKQEIKPYVDNVINKPRQKKRNKKKRKKNQPKDVSNKNENCINLQSNKIYSPPTKGRAKKQKKWHKNDKDFYCNDILEEWFTDSWENTLPDILESPESIICRSTTTVIPLDVFLENSKNTKKSRNGKRTGTLTEIIDTAATFSEENVLTSLELFPNHRQRTVSECDSEDSFIVFETEENLVLDDTEDEDLRLSDESSYEYVLEETDDEREPNNRSAAAVKSNKKKVRFAEDDHLCTIHRMVKWSYAYQAARKGPWEEYARDRERFGMRIKNLEKVLGKVLDAKLRKRIYRERFEDVIAE